MSANPRRENFESQWTAALDRRGVESVKAKVLNTGRGQDAEFRDLLPGYNRNPTRRFVETWLARHERRRQSAAWAFQIGALAITVPGVAIAL